MEVSDNGRMRQDSAHGPGGFLLIALASAACGRPSGTGADHPEERTAMSQLALCKTGADLARLDGQRVRVVGTYRREMVVRKQGEPPTLFLGHVICWPLMSEAAC
jgi:hypothetical protein